MPKFLDHHVSTPSVRISINSIDDGKLLYVVRLMKSLASRFVMFFLPLFLYELANSLSLSFLEPYSEVQKGIFFIAFYYGAQRLVVLLTSIPMARLSAKVGVSRSFILAQSLAITTYALLHFSTNHPWALLLVILAGGMEINLFWNNYQPLLDINSKKNGVGKDLGIVQFLINFSMMISPAIGGLVVTFFGYSGLFMTGIVIVMIGMMVSLMFHETKYHYDAPSWKEFFAWLKERSFLRLSTSFAGKYVYEGTLVLWPLYIFFLVGSIERVGFLYTFSLFLALIVSFFVGMNLDAHHGKKPFLFSGAILTGLWFLRMEVATVWNIAVVDTVDRLTGNYHWLFFDRKLMVRGRGKKVFSYFTYHEMVIALAAIFFWLGVGLLFMLFSNGWDLLFILGGVGVMLSLLVKEHK